MYPYIRQNSKYILCYYVIKFVALLFIASFGDFEQSFQTVTFSSWQSTKTVYIKIKGDDRVENTEALLKAIAISFLYHLQ